MNNTKEQPSLAKKNETNPILLTDSFYEYRPNRTRNNNTADQLVLWKSDKYNYNDKYNEIFNMDTNKVNEKITPEENNSNDEQCICMKAWKELKHIFELTDEELMNIHSLKNFVPDDKLYSMPIDLNNDDNGESLNDFHLDGEYLYTNNNNEDLYTKTNEFVNEKEPVAEKPKEYPMVQFAQTFITISKHKKQNSYENVRNKSERNKTPNKKTHLKKKVKLIAQDNNKKDKENNVKYDDESYRDDKQCEHKNCIEPIIPITSNKGLISDDNLNNIASPLQQRKKTNEKKLTTIQEGEKSLNKKKMANEEQ